MAEIFGISLKNLKSFIGHEGKCYQGSLYIEGKKIGFWTQDSWGGCDDYMFDKGYDWLKFENAVKDRTKGMKVKYGDYELDYSASLLMDDLVFLMELEKDLKRSVKKGYNGINCEGKVYRQANDFIKFKDKAITLKEIRG